MLMMTSQILKSVDFTKIQKSRYLRNKTLFFLQIKNSLITHQGYFIAKNSFVAEVTFKTMELVIAWFRVLLAINLTSENLRGVMIFWVLCTRTISFFKLPRVKFIVNCIFIVNNPLVLIEIQPKGISLEQIYYKRSQGIAVTSLHCLFFFEAKKQRPKTNLEKCYPWSSTKDSHVLPINVSIEISLDHKVCFSLVTY